MTEQTPYNQLMTASRQPSERLLELEAAFKDLSPLLKRIAYRTVRNTHDAEDVVQAAFISVCQAFEHGQLQLDEGRQRLRAVLICRTRGRAIDMIRGRDRSRRLLTRDHVGVQRASGEMDPAEEASHREQIASVRNLLTKGTLETEERALLFEAFILGKTIREIASEAKASVSTVHARLWKVIDKARRALSRNQT